MSEKRCPNQDELLAFADADLSPEQLGRIEKHLELCGSCAKQVMAVHSLIDDLAAPLVAPRLDMAEHVAGVMRRLDIPVATPSRSRWVIGGPLLAAAAALLVSLGLRSQSSESASEFAARGGPPQASLSRDVGLQLYAQEESPRALQPGGRVRRGTPLTAGLRNLGDQRVYLLLFAVDAAGVVHWIAPEFTVPGSDPLATGMEPSQREQLLPSAVVFDDLAAGPLRVVAVIDRKPARVSEIEALPSSELATDALMKRFPRAETRQFMLEVAP
jgi:hypothetical protein